MGTLPSLTQPCRYDSLTGLPAQQRALAFEKGSVLFNIGALHAQIGARQNRSCPEGIGRAVEAFQRAAGEAARPHSCAFAVLTFRLEGQSRGRGDRRGGPLARGARHTQALCEGLRARAGQPPLSPIFPAGAFSLLRENFSHAPSPDMSPASLSMLEQLMRAQAQECVFEGLLLQAPRAAHDCLAQLRLAQEAAQVRVGGGCPGGLARLRLFGCPLS